MRDVRPNLHLRGLKLRCAVTNVELSAAEQRVKIWVSYQGGYSGLVPSAEPYYQYTTTP